MKKNNLDSITVIILVTIFFIFINSDSSNNLNGLYITIALGLLTFIGIFYSLVIKQVFKNKRDELRGKHQEKILSNLKNDFEKLEKALKSEDYILAQGTLTSLNNQLWAITTFEKETDFNRNLLIIFCFFILSILIFITDLISTYNLRIAGFISLLIGVYFTSKIIFTWYFMFKKNDKEE